MLRTLLILGRTSNLPTVWTNVLAGWFLAGGTWTGGLAAMLMGISLLYVAGMTLNDAFDAGWDREYAPERPIPSGAISPGAAWLLGGGQLLAGAGIVLWFSPGSWTWIAGLVGAILLYDAIHKKTALAVLVMGVCRGLVYFAAASAVDPNRLPWWAAVGTAIYVVGITVLARSERASIESRSLGSRLAPLWLIAPVITGFVATAPDPLAKLFTLAWFLPLVAWCCRSLINQRVTGAVGPMVGRLIAGIVLIDAAVLGASGQLIPTAVAFVLLPVTVLMQRRIPAT